MFFLILFFLYKDKSLYIIRMIINEKDYKFNQKVIHLFKDGVLNVRKIENVFIFKLKGLDDNIDLIFDIL